MCAHLPDTNIINVVWQESNITHPKSHDLALLMLWDQEPAKWHQRILWSNSRSHQQRAVESTTDHLTPQARQPLSCRAWSLHHWLIVYNMLTGSKYLSATTVSLLSVTPKEELYLLLSCVTTINPQPFSPPPTLAAILLFRHCIDVLLHDYVMLSNPRLYPDLQSRTKCLLR